MNNDNDDKKEKIIKFLKEFGKAPAYRIQAFLGTNVEAIKKILNEMEIEGTIIKEEETVATYWRIKND